MLIRLEEMVVGSCWLNVDGSRTAAVMNVIDCVVSFLEPLLLKAQCDLGTRLVACYRFEPYDKRV